MTLFKLTTGFPFDDFARPSSYSTRRCDAVSPYGYDIIDNEKDFKLSVDVPGMKQSDLELTVEDGVIHVVGVRRKLSDDGETTKKIRFARNFRIDHETVDLPELAANLADGVLTISAPKKKKPEPRTIAITTKPTVEVETVEEAKVAAPAERKDKTTEANEEEKKEKKEKNLRSKK